MATGQDGEQEDPQRQVMGCVARWDREERYEQAASPQVSVLRHGRRGTQPWTAEPQGP